MTRDLILSVVTPAYNQAVFLRDTIDSVLNQDYPHIDYQVIDDGSTDSTAQLLEQYDGRFRWERQANRGQTPTINRGWSQAEGDILTWLNSDDTFLPGAVTKAMEYLRQNPDVGIVYGDTLFTEADGTPLYATQRGEQFDYSRFVGECTNPIPQPSAFIRRSVIEDVGPLDDDYYYFMDWDYWIRAGLRHRIVYIPEVLSTYRLHAESKTVSQALRAAPELERMYRTFFARADLTPQIRGLQGRAMASMSITSGGYYLKGGDAAAAARMARRALTLDPGLVCRPAKVHQILYCLLGNSAAYRGIRGLYHRLSPAALQS